MIGRYTEADQNLEALGQVTAIEGHLALACMPAMLGDGCARAYEIACIDTHISPSCMEQ